MNRDSELTEMFANTSLEVPVQFRDPVPHFLGEGAIVFCCPFCG